MTPIQALAPAAPKLTSLCYDENYYEQHKQAGLDYLGHGFWQASYAAMVTEATLQETYDEPAVLDAGCACGSILEGFKKTGLFRKLVGVDLSMHMVNLGRKAFKFTDDEIIAASIDSIPLPDASPTLINCGQVLQHIPDEMTEDVLAEFSRVLRPGGRAFICLDAVRHGESNEIYLDDPTRCNIQPVLYWTARLQAHGLHFDIEAYNRFVHSALGPTAGDPRSFYDCYPRWNVWTLVKAGQS